LCKVDRTGNYEEDVHKDLTTILAYAVGFTWDEAVQIGNENQKVDEDQRDPVQLGEAGYEARRDFHFTTPARRAELWHTFELDAFGSHPGLGQFRTSTREKAFYDLGTYLHTLQDSYSHAGFGPTFGHMFQGHAPDKTFSDVLKSNIMARDTYDALGRALKEFGFASANQVGWSKIKGYVDRFNRAKDSKEKKKILAELRGVIESERLERILKGRFGCIYGEGYSGIHH